MRFIKPISLSRKSFILDVRSPEEYALETLDLPHVYKCIDDLDPLTFIEENNLTGKNVYVFVTSGSSSSEGSFKDLKEAYPDINFISSKRLKGNESEEEYKDWIK